MCYKFLERGGNFVGRGSFLLVVEKRLVVVVVLCGSRRCRGCRNWVGGGLDIDLGWDGRGREWGEGLRVNVAGEVAEEGEADVDDYYVKVR